MSDQNSEEKTSCCGPAKSASAGESTSGCGPDCCVPAAGSVRRWKILVFVLIVGAAVAVGAHALLKKGRATDQETQQSFALATPEEEISEKTVPAVSGARLASLASLIKAAAGQDAVFILLPGENSQSAQAASRQVEEAVSKLRSKRKKVAAFTLEKSTADHARLVEQFSITSFPCVVALGRGCGSSLVSGELTEARLFQAFVAASTPPSSCEPTGCNPSGCQ